MSKKFPVLTKEELQKIHSLRAHEDMKREEHRRKEREKNPPFDAYAYFLECCGWSKEGSQS